MTYETRLVAGLGALGWTRDFSATTRKYKVFKHPQQEGSKMFVGPYGALRLGKSATDSHSIGCPGMERHPYWVKVLAKGDFAITHPQPQQAQPATRDTRTASLAV